MGEEERHSSGRSGHSLRHSKAQEALGILIIACSVFLLVSLLSYDPLDPSFFSSGRVVGRSVNNYAGRLGAELAGDLFEVLGLSALLFPPFLFFLGFRALSGRTFPSWFHLTALVLLILSLGLLSTLLNEQGLLVLSIFDRPGGFLGDELYRRLSPFVGRFGLYLVTVTFLLLALVLLSSRPLLSLATLWSETRLLFGSFKGKGRLRRTKPLPTKGAEKSPVARRPSPGLPSKPDTWDTDRGTAIAGTPSGEPGREGFETPPELTGPRGGGERPKEGFQVPPLSLLEPPPPQRGGISEEELQQNAEILEQKLRDFGLEGRVASIQPGPVITRYEIEPAPGIKINRIVALADDLALALRALSVRVVAPIPGKAVVGIEIPNRNRATVSLREVLSSQAFQDSPSVLPLALGVGIDGEPYVTDLLQMPHLLVAGATGSGKSICLHTLILSILAKSTPQEVRFLLIDPKRVELSIYDGLPHLADHVVFDAKEAAKKLSRVVRHMEERYKLFAEVGARNIGAYNRLGKPDGEGRPKSLPYLVVIVDELADLMLMATSEVEGAVARLAQMARAVGIHLIVATQRPSVDVITGIIKANFPARLSFQVSSKVDSRTILDMNGAEQLLGYGDMLFIPPGSSKPIRIHGCYVSEPEIRRVVDFLKGQGEADPFPWSLLPEEVKTPSEEEPDDQLYHQAVEIVVQTRQASISLLQRRLRVGFNRAARLIERMEAEGIVSPVEGSKPREVLIERKE